jgi:hypothetical protein
MWHRADLHMEPGQPGIQREGLFVLFLLLLSFWQLRLLWIGRGRGRAGGGGHTGGVWLSAFGFVRSRGSNAGRDRCARRRACRSDHGIQRVLVSGLQHALAKMGSVRRAMVRTRAGECCRRERAVHRPGHVGQILVGEHG